MTDQSDTQVVNILRAQVDAVQAEVRDLYALADTTAEAQIVARVVRPDFGILTFSRQNLAADKLLGGSLRGKMDADWIPEPGLAKHRQGVKAYLEAADLESEYLDNWQRRTVYRPETRDLMDLDVRISVWVPEEVNGRDPFRFRFVAAIREPVDVG